MNPEDLLKITKNTGRNMNKNDLLKIASLVKGADIQGELDEHYNTVNSAYKTFSGKNNTWAGKPSDEYRKALNAVGEWHKAGKATDEQVRHVIKGNESRLFRQLISDKSKGSKTAGYFSNNLMHGTQDEDIINYDKGLSLKQRYGQGFLGKTYTDDPVLAAKIKKRNANQAGIAAAGMM